jgi:hypothetical protein
MRSPRDLLNRLITLWATYDRIHAGSMGLRRITSNQGVTGARRQRSGVAQDETREGEQKYRLDEEVDGDLLPVCQVVGLRGALRETQQVEDAVPAQHRLVGSASKMPGSSQRGGVTVVEATGGSTSSAMHHQAVARLP